MNNLDARYHALLEDILYWGVEKKDRTGTGTISVFGRQIRHKMNEGFPILTTKKVHFKSVATELMWFLRGDTNIKYLVDNDCHIWDGDAYKSYVKTVTKKSTTDIKEYEGDCDYELVTGTVLEDIGSKYDYYPIPFTKERFIERIKSDNEFAKKWGELGPIYGKQWRRWTKKKMWLSTDGSYEKIYDEADQTVVDQIAGLINELKTNPDSRRLMVSAWNVGELDQMVLPPCHYGFQVYTRELTGEERWELLKQKVGEEKFKIMVDEIVPFGGGLSEELQSYNIPKRTISLMWNQRSVDTFLGLPFNIASYGLLLEIIAKEVNMVPDELIGNLGDVHLYSNHIEQAKEQISREPFDLPKLKHMTHLDGFTSWLSDETYGMLLRPKDFVLDNYQSHPTIKAPLSN